jgi:predicted CoA-binding protein
MPVLESDEPLTDLLTHSKIIAVVGLSADPTRDSNRVARFMKEHGYTILPVNPNVSSVFGIPSSPDLESITGTVDIVNIFRRSEYVADIVASAIKIKAKAVWMQLGVIDESAAEMAAAAGLRVVMDRCILVEYRRLVQ